MTEKPTRRNLRAVSPNERKASRPRNVIEAAEMGERPMLVALRARLAFEIDKGPPAHAVAALVRQLREIDAAIRALDERAEQEQGETADATADEAWTGEL